MVRRVDDGIERVHSRNLWQDYLCIQFTPQSRSDARQAKSEDSPRKTRLEWHRAPSPETTTFLEADSDTCFGPQTRFSSAEGRPLQYCAFMIEKKQNQFWSQINFKFQSFYNRCLHSKIKVIILIKSHHPHKGYFSCSFKRSNGQASGQLCGWMRPSDNHFLEEPRDGPM